MGAIPIWNLAISMMQMLTLTVNGPILKYIVSKVSESQTLMQTLTLTLTVNGP